MEMMTRQTLAASALERYRRQYRLVDNAETIVTIRLAELGANPNPDDVDRIMGNDSWTRMRCHECGRCDAAVVVRLGEPPDYESNTADICGDCLKTAAALAVGSQVVTV